MTDPEVLEVSVHIAASPDTVFPYFTDADRVVEWMGDRAMLDSVPGGRYSVHVRDGIVAAGEFVEIDPPKRVVLTWGWTGHLTVPPGSTQVVVTLEEEDGGTRVLLRHYGLPNDAQRAQHRTGWEMYLGRLRIRADGGDPGPDPHA